MKSTHLAPAALAGLLAMACQDAPPPPEPALRPVRWTAVSTSSGMRERAFTGTAKADTEAVLSFKVPGTVMSLPVNVGDSVQAGDLIAELDRADYELQVQQASADLADAEASQRKDDAEYQRYRELYESENVSLSDLESKRAQAESSRASVEAASKRLEIAQLQLSYTRLEAPVDGAIAETSVDTNENVAAGTPIARLTSGERIEVDVAVPEVLIGQVRQSSPVEVTFDALPGRTYAGVVAEIGVAATALETTFPVTARLTDETPDVRPGMAARVTLQLGDASARPRFLVPAVAVGEDRGGRFVFIVQDDGPNTGRIERRGVTIGDFTAGGEIEIFEGLQDGERVVVRGVSKIQDGMAVRLPESGLGS